ncbi:Gfo/Idh/MocA family protein [Nostoc sp.]|uniref:Gfo/Idh/MocA family protein n=1 Tax=Nostoc sp. TaxID=1180 RepID=UPI00359348CF
MKRLRVAVVGAGHLGRIHTRLIQSVDEVELVGVADSVEEARQRVAAEFHTAAFASHHELIGKIDAAIVATPTKSHHAVGLELLKAGVHVLIEKPITLTVPEADELVAAAAARRLVLQVGHVERFNPALAAVEPHVSNPKFIEATRTSGYTFRSTDIGVVLDLMIHDLDVVLSLVRSEVIDVQALGIAVFGPHEDMAHARLVFANGCVANLNASRTSFDSHRKMQIYAERAYAGVDFATGAAKIVRPNADVLARELDVHRLSPAEQMHVKENLFRELLVLEEIQVEKRNAILDEQHDFVISIRSGGEPRVPGRQARDALLVAHRILDQIAAHRWSGTPQGPTGPHALPTPSVLRGPHWTHATRESAIEKRKAG